MSVFTALKRARSKIEEFPKSTFNDAARICMQTSSDGTPHDYKTALTLHEILPSSIINLDAPTEIRRVLSILIREYKFDWSYLFPLGREAIKNSLSRNEYQVFRNGELFQDVPSFEVVLWWDEIANEFRTSNLDNTYREFERKSLELERQYLTREKCPFEPTWVALNDNSLGFDIRSFRSVDGEWQPLAVEVKSSVSSHLKFYISKNEVNLAIRMGRNYSLHYWSSEALLPRILNSNQIQENLPIEQGNGKWESILIEDHDILKYQVY